MARRALALTAAGWIALLAWPSSAAACSPPFERPTIRALGPAQLVVVGTVGERVPGGRLFHVERWFNGGEPETPIVIGFKEGEPVGDCSYPVSTDERKIIAPSREPDGSLYADLATLQRPGVRGGTALHRRVDDPVRPRSRSRAGRGPSAPDAVVSGPFQVIALAALVAAVAGVLIVAFRRA